ncbi:MAG TPA: DNA (cytosine-5-)-methyltransferase [Aeromicrobium sp.]|nr:DNA (cytosine-5-)-methyltransferase [Aeromicrobium sp.]HKY57618.1 DNA (cytosine-5-)-methyltransferase [Aeromicrobium sp.]
MTAVSLFAGVGGFDLALERNGIDINAAVEIDDAARGVLADRFPNTTLFTDVTEVTGDQLRATGFVPERGILTAGFPCQDLSVAGRRKGMASGTRSGLYWHVVRLLADLRPRWVILENVPGLLSAVCPCPGNGTCGEGCEGELHQVPGGTCGPGRCMVEHGGAMGAVLGSLGELGYGFAYRVLDAQFFGVPQRRRRVVIVGCLGDERRPVEVLLEPEGSSRHSAPSSEERARIAATLTAGTSSRGVSAPGRRQEDDENLVVANCLTAREGKGPDSDATTTLLVHEVVSTLQGGGQRGHRIDAEAAAGGHLLVHPLAVRGREGGAQLEVGPEGGPYNALRAGDGGSSRHALVAISTSGEQAHTLTAEGHDASEDGTGRGTPVIAFAWQAGGNNDASGAFEQDMTPTLPRSQTIAIQDDVVVRRLTPMECERLQGFDDRWTASSNGKQQPDSPRYRQMGNAIAVPVFDWVIARIKASEVAA